MPEEDHIYWVMELAGASEKEKGMEDAIGR
jgi:hypothetical protein